jgi:hypothetical protein
MVSNTIALEHQSCLVSFRISLSCQPSHCPPECVFVYIYIIELTSLSLRIFPSYAMSSRGINNPIRISKLLPAAQKAVATLSAKIQRSQGDGITTVNEDMENALLTAESLLEELRKLDNQFRKKVVEYGDARPSKDQGGHFYFVRQQCLGDGDSLQSCGRWFVKVTFVHITYV